MDGERREVEITDWDAVLAEMERFCAEDHLHAENDLACCSAGSATIEIHASGRLSGSMPLHEFDGRVDLLTFDHEAGTITAESGEVSYTFRRPARSDDA
ncbi:MAG: hypothetical protein QXG03_01825 [Halalkalicoccus sp.]